MTPRNLIIALILLLFSDMHQGGQLPKKAASKNLHHVFGIAVHKPTLTLKNKVEELYGKPLCVVSYQDREKCGSVTEDRIEGSVGFSVVSTEGDPIIVLSETGQNESTLVHELFHLKLKAEGYPILQYNIHKSLNRDVINLLVALVFTALEHRVYYPEMRKMGIDPDELERRELDRLMSRSEQADLGNEFQVLHRAATYFRTTIECGGACKREETLKRLTEWYEKHGWLTSLSVAREMILTAEKRNPNNAVAVTNTAFECVTHLMNGKVRISGSPWEERKRGRITEKLVPYYAMPAN